MADKEIGEAKPIRFLSRVSIDQFWYCMESDMKSDYLDIWIKLLEKELINEVLPQPSGPTNAINLVLLFRNFMQQGQVLQC